MKYSSTAKRGLVCLSYVAFLLFGMFLCGSQSFAASPPLKTINTAVVPVGSQYQLNFSVTDPTRGVVAGNSGVIDLSSWGNNDGVVYWIYWVRNPDLSLSKMVGFSVYDPKTGVWNNRTTVGIDTDVVSSVGCAGGVVTWKGFSGAVRFAIFDSELNGWVIGSSTTIASTIGIIDGTGTVAWRTSNGVGAAVYNPAIRQFSVGVSAALAIPVTFWLDTGTVNYTANGVPGKLGYNPFNGVWGNFNTVPRAYFIPSRTTGNVPLPVFFWDLSIGANGWNYSFGDGNSSNVSNPFYTYNSAAGAPYNAVLTVSGPGGTNSLGRAITPTTPHSISGTAANANGFKIPNATVTLSGTISRTTQTDGNGNYSFTNLTANGNYTVTIAKARTVFSPATRTYNNLTGAQSGNFTGKLNDKPSDFDGDGKTDVSIFRPSSTEWWISNSSNNSVNAVSYGYATDKLTPRDFDGDGKTDIAVWRPADGNWYILQSSTGTTSIKTFGVSGDIPVANDYDGDDKADPAVFRPSTGNWYILSSSTSQASQLQFGLGTDKPVIGDYDGDEKGDFAVFRESDLTWYVLRSSDFGTTIQAFGQTGDKAVQGDYDGDAKTDFATFSPASGLWQIRRSSDAQTVLQNWGYSTDNLAPGDYDGDGKTDVAVFRSSMGTWYALLSSNQSWFTPSFGSSGDYPTPQSYLPE